MAGGRFLVDSPQLAHDLAYAAGWDAVSRAQRDRIGKGSRAKRLEPGVTSITPLRMTPADRTLFVETVQRWYANFNILNARQWMPEGYAWKKIAGQWRPVAVTRQGATS